MGEPLSAGGSGRKADSLASKGRKAPPSPSPSGRGRGEGLGFQRNAIIVAVGAVIFDGAERVLLVKHVPERRSFWQGKWICPGGRLQVGESIEQGILREIWEETRLQIRLSRPLPPFERIVHGKDGVMLHVIYLDYVAEKIGGELQAADDVGEAIWVPRLQLPALGEDLHEDTRRLLELAHVMESPQLKMFNVQRSTSNVDS